MGNMFQPIVKYVKIYLSYVELMRNSGDFFRLAVSLTVHQCLCWQCCISRSPIHWSRRRTGAGESSPLQNRWSLNTDDLWELVKSFYQFFVLFLTLLGVLCHKVRDAKSMAQHLVHCLEAGITLLPIAWKLPGAILHFLFQASDGCKSIVLSMCADLYDSNSTKCLLKTGCFASAII